LNEKQAAILDRERIERSVGRITRDLEALDPLMRRAGVSLRTIGRALRAISLALRVLASLVKAS